MPLPAALARANKVVTNRITSRFAGRMPLFAIVHHTGRKSGKAYATPVMVFKRGSDFVIALTYGAETEWCENVLAAGGCTLEYRNRRCDVTQPAVVGLAEVRESLPGIVRFILKRIRVKEALVLAGSDEASARQ
jgi:deazaflavin-dependent oxidoreductase (nitroreductase family)